MSILLTNKNKNKRTKKSIKKTKNTKSRKNKKIRKNTPKTKNQYGGERIPRLPIQNMSANPEMFEAEAVMGYPQMNKNKNLDKGLMNNSLKKAKKKEENKKKKEKDMKAYYLNKRGIIKNFKVNKTNLKNSSKKYYFDTKVKSLRNTLKQKKYKVSFNKRKNKKRIYQSLEDKLK